MARTESLQRVYKNCRPQLSSVGRKFADDMVAATRAGDFQKVELMFHHDAMEPSFTDDVSFLWEVWFGQMWDEFVASPQLVHECVAHGMLVADDVECIRKHAA